MLVLACWCLWQMGASWWIPRWNWSEWKVNPWFSHSPSSRASLNDVGLPPQLPSTWSVGETVLSWQRGVSTCRTERCGFSQVTPRTQGNTSAPTGKDTDGTEADFCRWDENICFIIMRKWSQWLSTGTVFVDLQPLCSSLPSEMKPSVSEEISCCMFTHPNLWTWTNCPTPFRRWWERPWHCGVLLYMTSAACWIT